MSLTLCKSTCNLVHALMYKHFLLKAVFPKLLKLVQFPYVIPVNPLTYTIWTSLLYNCFAFYFQFLLHTLSQTSFYILHLISCIHINKTYHHAVDFQQYQHVSWCSYVHMDILILFRIVLNILYLYIQYTITLHLQYSRHINFKK